MGNDVLAVLVLEGSLWDFAPRSDFPAPAEPPAAVVLQRRPQRHLKPAGALGAIAGGNRNTIGYDRQARQYRPQSSATECLAVKTKPVEETVKERMSTRNLWFDCRPLVIGQNGRNNGGLAEMGVRRKTAFHSSNRQNVRSLADRKTIPNKWRSRGLHDFKAIRVRRELQREQRITSQHPESSCKRWFGFRGGSRPSLIKVLRSSSRTEHRCGRITPCRGARICCHWRMRLQSSSPKRPLSPLLPPP